MIMKWNESWSQGFDIIPIQESYLMNQPMKKSEDIFMKCNKTHNAC